jgi:fatty acid/phospholipid biosynthesis enzyme
MKRRSGAVILAGDCVALLKSNKQKMNIRSSTETELAAVHDVLPTVQWTKSFMVDQGYDLDMFIKMITKVKCC